MAAPICLFWTAWRGRNRAVFDNVEITALGLKSSLAYSLWSWSRSKACTDFDSGDETDFLLSSRAV